MTHWRDPLTFSDGGKHAEDNTMTSPEFKERLVWAVFLLCIGFIILFVR